MEFAADLFGLIQHVKYAGIGGQRVKVSFSTIGKRANYMPEHFVLDERSHICLSFALCREDGIAKP